MCAAFTICSEIPDVLIVLGPTTTGKSKLAAKLARQLDGEILNADKFYLFDDFAIGTGRADIFEHPDLKFHLYGVLPAKASIVQVGTWGQWMMDTIQKIRARNKLVVIEGSSFGLIDTAIRILKSQNRYSWRAMGTKLVKTDGLEEAIVKRVQKAHQIGLLDETEDLMRRGLQNSWVMRKSVVYSPLMRHLKGGCSLEAANQEIGSKVCTAAKEQWRKFQQIPEVAWLESAADVLVDV